jgi:hypothetical protein
METSAPASGRQNIPVYASYAVVLGMVICFSVVAIYFLQWIVPTWDARGMVVVCILAAIEAVASHWLINRLPTAQRQPLYYRFTEWLIILVVLKLFVELLSGPAGLWNNFRVWLVNFPFNIFNARYLLSILLVFVIWQISNLFNFDLSLLGTFESSLLDERVKTTPVRDLILRRFLNLGMFVVLLAGIPSQVVIPSPQPVVSNNAVPAVIAYFVLGIILLSLTRYTGLVTGWKQAKVAIPPQISRRWFIYSAILIGFLVMLISWLPTNYGLGLMDTLTAILGLIYQAITTVYIFILFLIRYIFTMLFHPERVLPAAPVLPEPPPQEALPPVTPIGINWTLIKSILFWAALIILVVIALRQYILFNKDLAEELKHFRPFRWLALFWKRFTASVKKANKSVGIFVQSSLKRLRSLGRTPRDLSDWEYINPRRLNARQKIIFYYLALLRRTGEVGLARHDGQTPYEYARSLTSTLDPALQEGREGVENLTASFVEARYSLHDIPPNEARRVESLWETIRRILRNVRKSQREKEKQERE